MSSLSDGLEDLVLSASAFGVTVEGLKNPSKFAERTGLNRAEGKGALVGHTLELAVPEDLRQFASGHQVVGRGGKVKETFEDPYLRISPKLSVDYIRTEDGAKKKFVMGKSTLFTKTTKMSAASWSLPAGPRSISGTCAAAEIFKSPAAYDVALRQGDVEQRAPNPKTWIYAYCYAGKSNYMYRNSQYAQLTHAV